MGYITIEHIVIWGRCMEEKNSLGFLLGLYIYTQTSLYKKISDLSSPKS